MSLLLQLGLYALLVALLPLAVVWASRDADKFRKLVWVTLFFTFDLILFGAFTRLTDSGLGCPDWPGCYGHASPLQALSQISAAEAAMPTGPVTLTKAWIEMIHRYLASAIGVLIIALMVVAWRNWLKSARSDNRFSPWLPTFLFILVCVQGAFGAWTVTLKLQPLIVSIHLVLGMGLLGLLTWLAARQERHLAVTTLASSFRFFAPLAMAILAVQIALGGWVSSNYAALACSDFPLCHGLLVPKMDFENGFTLWRDLGKTASGEYLSFPALTAIHWTHRLFALLVAAVVGWVGYCGLKVPGLRKTAVWMLVVLAVQIALGAATVFFKWPLALAVAHNGGAALLVALLTMLNYKALALAKTAPDQVTTRLSSA